MKKTAWLALFSFSLIFSHLGSAYAANYITGPIQKLSRGVVHVVASPFQIAKEVIETTGEGETVWLAPWKGMTEGAGRGLYQASRQILSGFADIFTFWTPAGKNWGPVIESDSMFPQI